MQDILTLGEELKSHTYEFTLLPSLWSDRDRDAHLRWRCVAFGPDSTQDVPDDASGVYAFCVHPQIGGDLKASYVMYVGETSRALRDRYKDYLVERNAKKPRPKLARLFKQLDGHACLMFCFATVDGEGDQSPKSVEARLLEALIPPSNSELPARIRSARRAFQ